QRTACLILPVYKSGKLSPVTRAADTAAGGLISELLDNGDFNGESGNTLLARTPEGTAFERVLLVGCGERKAFDRPACRKALAAAFHALGKTRLKSAACGLTLEAVHGADASRRARMALEVWHDVSYRFTEMKTNDKPPEIACTDLALLARSADAAKARKGLRHGQAVGLGMALTRDLGNLPGNVCTPSYLAKQARALAKGVKALHVQVLDEPELRKLGMGALLSVTAGTKQPAKFIVLNYKGGTQKKAPIVLVGKGITFDAGGISLKPPAQMDEMKYDMCGAATVLGVMRAVTELKLPINLVGLIPSCENLPSGTATKPGDIVKSLSGKSIEILNTDAEGRLILCDALTYAQRFKPAALIDIATLTGACLIALGRHRSGLLGNSDRLANALLRAGEHADDPAWRLPIDPPYQDQLRSNFADMANVGGREAGTITAACFLSRFVGDSDWAHLDIAGTAWRQGKQKGATGRPVPLLMEYLLT
ncbi:MAG TPA: leucyl aminopeptidase, partial [Chromatiales bacterium]|nr:leucyl aminopeptidase [Chromatiales bacterium]